MLSPLASACRWDGAVAAAWVQAVGSVAAIVAAVLLPRLEGRRGRRQAAAAAREIAVLVRRRIDDLIGFAEAGIVHAPRQIDALDLNGLEAVLARFPMETLPSAALRPFVGLIGLCQQGQRIWFVEPPVPAKVAQLSALKHAVAAIDAEMARLR